MSIRIKLLWPLLLFMILIALYAQMIWLPQAERFSIENTKTLLGKTLQTVSEGVVPLLLEGQLSNIYDTLDIVKENNSDWVYLALDDEQGRSLYPFEPHVVETNGRYLQKLSHEITVEDKALGTLTLIYDFTPAANTIKKNIYILLGLIMTALCTFFAVAGMLIYLFILKPVTQLKKAAQAMADGNYNAALPGARQDEIGALIHNFDYMRLQIQSFTRAILEEKELAEKEVQERLQVFTEQHCF